MAPIDQPQTASQPATGDGHDWVSEGRRFLSDGDIPNALFAANQATGVDGKNPEAWALSAQAKYRWGKVPDAVYEYRRAIDLRPNEAKYYFDLGGVFEEVEDWPNALQQYQWASRIDPMSTVYRASVGEVFYQLDRYEEAIAVLLQCVAEAPNNRVYKNYLAMAYCIGAYENWTYIPPDHPSGLDSGHYATTKLQVDEALASVQKAQALQLQDPEVQDRVHQIQGNMQDMLKRHFHGNWFAAGFATLIGLFSLLSSPIWGLFWLACGVGYAISCFIPQYIINRRIVKGQALSANNFLVNIFVEGGVGCTGMIIGLVLIMLTLPVVTIVNFMRNWVLATQPTEAEKQRLARMQPPMQPPMLPPQQQPMPEIVINQRQNPS